MIDKILVNFFHFVSTPVYAADPPQLYEIIEIVEKVFGWIFPAGVLIAVAMIIVGGYMWIVSGGDPGRKQQAQGTLTWSVIGLVLLFVFYWILQAIIDFVLP